MGRKIVVRKGERYKLLTIICEVESKDRFRYFECLCDCGNRTVVNLQKLRSGHTSSCGCLRNRSQKKPPKNLKMGRLTYQYDVDPGICRNGKTKRKAMFLCECGNLTVTYMTNVVSSKTKSCGCLKIENASNYKHGCSDHIAYSRWKGMIDRCYNPECQVYKYYGERGITVCDEWLESARAYCDWFDANCTDPDHEVDRRDNTKGYSPENCRIVTRSVNMTNTRNSVIYEVNGVSFRRTQDAEEALNMSIKTIRKRALSPDYPEWKRHYKYNEAAA